MEILGTSTKAFCFFCVIFISVFSAGALPNLQDYLSSDLELQNLALEVKKAELASKSTSIENGIDVQLSTGKATFFISGNSSQIKFSPSVSVSIPQAASLTLSASSDIKISESEGDGSLTNASIALSADLISSSGLDRKISLQKADRTLLKAKRALQDYALSAENNYYSSLKNLYDLSSNIISAQKTMYEDTMDFEEIKTKGYSQSSAKYRQAELAVFSAKHSVETKKRELEHECAIFAAKCGTSYDSSITPQNFIPSDIPDMQALDILLFEKDLYSKIESSTYDAQLAELSRKAQKNFSLKANAGYTFKNSSTGISSTSDTNSYSDTVDFGTDFSWAGISISPGFSLPFDKSPPIYSLTAKLAPSSIIQNSITKQTNELNKEQELIAIRSAQNSYEEDVVDMQNQILDINWSTKTNKENYDMYNALEKDMKNYFSSGMITESEYLNALANKELYRIKMIVDKINLIIYNNNLKLLFCRDNEING